jgi:hypothetical protein
MIQEKQATGNRLLAPGNKERGEDGENGGMGE